MEMQESQEYAQNQFSEERRQRVSQAKKRYNCYTESIVIVARNEVASQLIRMDCRCCTLGGSIARVTQYSCARVHHLVGRHGSDEDDLHTWFYYTGW